jgi:hypothetical protein
MCPFHRSTQPSLRRLRKLACDERSPSPASGGGCGEGCKLNRIIPANFRTDEVGEVAQPCKFDRLGPVVTVILRAFSGEVDTGSPSENAIMQRGIERIPISLKGNSL